MAVIYCGSFLPLWLFFTSAIYLCQGHNEEEDSGEAERGPRIQGPPRRRGRRAQTALSNEGPPVAGRSTCLSPWWTCCYTCTVEFLLWRITWLSLSGVTMINPRRTRRWGVAAPGQPLAVGEVARSQPWGNKRASSPRRWQENSPDSSRQAYGGLQLEGQVWRQQNSTCLTFGYEKWLDYCG